MAVLATELFARVQAEHVHKAIKQLQEGVTTRFADSTKFDVLYQGRRYAPKEVGGLALEAVTNAKFGPKDFKGGEESPCFNALRRCGFIIVPKRSEKTVMPLVDVIAEILNLQTKYSSTNTEEMQRRGFLIRTILPDKIRDHLEDIEPIFANAGYSCAVEGSDGKGRKNESPWVRIADLGMSPSATRGWYVVLHFSRDGQRVYSTLGCGATTFVAGSLIDVPDADLARQVAWAREIASNRKLPTKQFSGAIELGGNNLSRQFEKATAFSKAHAVSKFDESVFWNDLVILCRMLVVIYEGDRLGKAPLSEVPEVVAAQESAEDIARPKSKKGRGQGKGLNHAERVAVEQRAMKVAHDGLLSSGYSDIADKSASESYDYAASKHGHAWLIEVKGTTSRVCDCFMLTAAELKLHRKHSGKTVLAIVFDIDLKRGEVGPIATGGTLELFEPWNSAQWQFEPTAYRASKI